MTDAPGWFWGFRLWLWSEQEYGWALGLLATVCVGSALVFWLALRREEEDSRAGLARWVRRRGWRGAYKSAVVWLLDRTDHLFLTPDQAATLPLTGPARAWSARMLDGAMLWAVLYPFLLLIVQWTFAGGPDDWPTGGNPAEPNGAHPLCGAWLSSTYFVFVQWTLGRSGQAEQGLPPERAEPSLSRSHSQSDSQAHLRPQSHSHSQSHSQA